MRTGAVKFLIGLLLFQWGGIAAIAGAIVPADKATTTYTAPNGVPVVHIARPNAAGLSHNRYGQFSVNANGAVLNNSAQVSQSQLAGAIRGNPNLSAANTASIILNEVTSTNRSVLNGFLEVHGQSADVIVANPNGITANGLGFINTNRAVLTTGVPNINAAGALTGFDVRRGDILLQGAGINASATGFLDLVSRSLNVQAQVNAKDLYITTGSNSWDYLNRTQTGLAGTGEAPLFAVDTALLGGMYADRIKLVATEAGVGVRMLGDAAASVDDITVNANGIVELKNKINAAKNMAVTYNGIQTGSTIIANADTSISAGNDITLVANNGDITLSTAKLASLGTLTLTATTGAISNASGGSQAVESSGNMNVNAKTTITNNGKFLAGGNLTVRGTDAATALIVTNAGRMQSGATMDMAGAGGNKQVKITNTNSNSTALLLAAQQLNINALEVNNSGAIHSRADSAITSDRLTNSNTAGYSASGNLALTTTSDFNNAGALFAGTGLTITASNNLLTNAESGTMDSNGVMTLSADRFHNYNNLNASGDITINTTTEFKNLVYIRGGSLTPTTTTYGLWSGAEMAVYNNVAANYGRADIDHGKARFLPLSGGILNDLTGLDFNGGWNVYQYVDHRDASYHVRGYLRAQKKIIERNKITGTADKSQILSSGVLTLNIGAGTALNQGAIMSAPTVKVLGSGSITNDMLSHTLDSYISKYKYMVQYKLSGFVNQITSFNRYFFWDSTNSGTSDRDFHQSDGGLLLLPSPTNYIAHIPSAISETSAINSAIANPILKSSTQLSGSIGAGVFANTLDIQVGGSVTNAGSVVAASTTARQSNLSTLDNTAALPTNPNGLFVTTQNSNAAFLVESNPRFGLDANYLGSDYLLGKLGNKIDTDENIRRLGDAAYENKLIADQLIKQTGRNILKGFKQDAAAQTKALFDNAVRASEDLNLSYGIALSKEQVNNLKADMVWMVKKMVNGVEVLAPVVYLAQATLDENDPSAATLSAGNMSIKAKDFLNEGGDVEGSETLAIETEGDIRNVSGNISGGNVALTSTDGSIINEVADIGNGVQMGGKASISAGNLEMDAAEDIRNRGGNIDADNASLQAGRSVIFDSLQTRGGSSKSNVSAGNLAIKAKDFLNRGGNVKVDERLAIETEGNISNIGGNISGGDVALKSSDGSIINQSTVSADGRSIAQSASISARNNLDLDAGKDISNLGAQMSAGKNASLKAKNDIIFDTIETTTRSSSKSSSGSGKNSKTTETVTVSTHNTRSGLNVGGNLEMDAGRDIVIAGSDVAAGGDAALKAGRDQKFLAREDTTTRYSKSVEKVDKSSRFKKDKTTTTKTTNSLDGRAITSTLRVGGDLTRTAGATLRTEGAKISAGGDYKEQATDILNLAAQDRHESKTVVDVKHESMNAVAGLKKAAKKAIKDAKKGVSSQMAAVQNSGIGRGVSAGANQFADSAVGKVVVGAAEKTANHYKNQALLYKDLAVGAANSKVGKLALKGAGKVLEVQQKGMERTKKAMEKAIELQKLSPTGRLMEMAKDKAKDKLKDKKVAVSAETSLSDSTETTDIASTKARVTTIDVGGSMERTATNEIKDVGTEIAVGKNFKQKADTITSLAARDTHEVNVHTDSLTVGAKASAGASFGQGGGTATAAVSVTSTETNSNRKSTTAQAGSIKVGGNFSSESTNDTLLEGTNIDVGGNAEISAGRLEVLAARDTLEKEETSTTVSVEQSAQATLDKQLIYDGSQEIASTTTTVQTDLSKDTLSQSTAKAGSLNIGGNLKIKTKDGMAFEGTGIDVGGSANLDAGSGNIDMMAAVDTEEKTHSEKTITLEQTKALRVAAGVKTGDLDKVAAGEGAPEVSGGDISAELVNRTTLSYKGLKSEQGKTTAKAGFIKAGKGLSMKADEVNLEGTGVEGGNVAIDANSLNFTAAENTYSQKTVSHGESGTVEVAVGVQASSNFATVGGAVSAEVEGEVTSEQSSQAQTGYIRSKGKIEVNTVGDALFEGVEIQSDGDTILSSSEGSIDFKAARDTHKASSYSGKVEGEVEGSIAFGVTAVGGDGSVSASAEIAMSQENSSDATAGSVSSGGKLVIQSKKDVNLEGTNLNADGLAVIESKEGDVNITAARSTSSKVSFDAAVSGEVSGGFNSGNKEMGASGSVEANGSYEKSDQAAAGSIRGANGVVIKSKHDVNLEGTAVESDGNINVTAEQGDVNLTAAKSSVIGLAGGISASVGTSKSSSGKGKDKESSSEKSKEMGVNISGKLKEKYQGPTFKSGNKINISSGNGVNLENTKLNSAAGTSVKAGSGKVNKTTAHDVDVSLSLSMSKEKSSESDTAASDNKKTTKSSKTSASRSFSTGTATSTVVDKVK